MPGRNAKPIRLHLLEGNPNRLTKEQIEERLENEVHIGSDNFEEPSTVKKNKIAHKTWQELMTCRETAEADWITSADTKLLEMICMTSQELHDLDETRRELYKKAKKENIDIFNLAHLSDQLNIDNKINKKRELLNRFLSQIYWTPLSRYKNIGKKKESSEKESPLQQAGFGNV